MRSSSIVSRESSRRCVSDKMHRWERTRLELDASPADSPFAVTRCTPKERISSSRGSSGRSSTTSEPSRTSSLAPPGPATSRWCAYGPFPVTVCRQIFASDAEHDTSLQVNISLRVLTRPRPEKLPEIYRTLGTDWSERVLPSIIQARHRRPLRRALSTARLSLSCGLFDLVQPAPLPAGDAQERCRAVQRRAAHHAA